ncbi:methylthioadenosine phosphorylase [Solemya pervernicosa gill symbiont]|uniref:Probable S-methyl-5'-thioinosine phosphorylase n=2 Tax=Gammaproteobacteria incertae sedis TaxID=118884 RepID=A0A1T2LAB0_9GAMM|nr:S-methyl-5'-thioinosine phosphorylase [Candidatus Reidiella endopervernicosa]OOZ42048.1 methylthioadenosine phosphorylase [Solemya pervernicosa gill symbiont]QKQ27003.1 S-methyl-5'-thioinosine phosphorylase [Candidatus Reidiella endopervernicosa]
MEKLAIIGGTGLTSINTLEITQREVMHTPYGEPSGPLTHGKMCGREVVFLARHGTGHTIPPHMVNYRANLWALKELGVEKILAVAAVGGIREDMPPGKIVIPDQIIDYTYGRDHTLFESDLTHVTHIDFTEPYCNEMRGLIIEACQSSGIDFTDNGTYGATQGPRLETAAEIDKMERDGCHLVGMTGMPEASIAREFELCYATCAVVANWAAGRSEGPITMEEIDRHLSSGMERVAAILHHLTPYCYPT